MGGSEVANKRKGNIKEKTKGRTQKSTKSTANENVTEGGELGGLSQGVTKEATGVELRKRDLKRSIEEIAYETKPKTNDNDGYESDLV